MHEEDPWVRPWEGDVLRGREEIPDIEWANFRRLAGPLLAEMLDDPQATIKFMHHPDAGVRQVALEVYKWRWDPKAGSQFAMLCAEMAVHDPAESVRNSAILALARTYERTDDVPVGRTLADIVMNDQETPLCRSNAYLGLFFVRGRRPPFEEWLRKYRGVLVPVPEGVDWDFVRSFLVPQRAPSPEAGSLERVMGSVPQQIRPSALAFLAYQKALAVYERGRYEQCIDILTERLAASPSRECYLLRGGALVRLGHVSEAMADFSRAIELSPRWPRAYRSRAVACRLMGLEEQAREDEQAAERLEREGYSDRSTPGFR